MKDHPLSNAEMLEELSKTVYGHTAAKKAIINTINRQRLRWHQVHSFGIEEDHALENHNLLLVGASGTGKTLLVQAMSKLCDFPLMCYDATRLTVVGGKGDLDVTKVIKEIKENVNYYVKKSQGLYSYSEVMSQLVVFIDEFDKLGIELHSGSNWNKEVQSSLLQLVANTDPEISGVTFIFAGAFSNVFESKKEAKKDKRAKGLGFTFSHDEDETEEIDWDIEITKNGIKNELAGRVHQVVCLDELTIDHYYAIMQEHVIPAARRDLLAFGVNLDISQEQIDEIIEKSMSSSQGVRMMKKKVAAICREAEFTHDIHTHTPSEDRLTRSIINDTKQNSESTDNTIV